MAFFVYLLRCADQSIYVGHTDDLERRLAQHVSGEIPGFTTRLLPVEPLWAQEFPSRAEALARELQIKRWSRAKKLALARQDWMELRRLSRGRGNRASVPARHKVSP